MPNHYVVLNQKDSKDIRLGEVRAVLMPPELEDLVVTPSTEAQDITPTKGKYFKDVKVEPVTADIDSNIQENNIRAGVTILGKTGNLAPDKPDQVKTTTPSKERQHIKADTGYELAENIVEPIPDEYEDVRDEVAEQNEYIEEIASVLDGQDVGVVDVTNTTATANDVVKGKQFYSADGTLTEGVGDLVQELTGFDEIDLPSGFTRSNVYSFKSSQGHLFISSSNDTADSRGIYKFNKELKQFEKVLFDSNGYNYQTWFESSDGRIFCTAYGYAEEIHWYNEELNEFVKLDMNASTSNGTFTELNNGQICFVGMQAGVCLINKDNSVFRIPNPWQTSFLYYDKFHDMFFFKNTSTSAICMLNNTKDDIIELTYLGTTQPNFWSSSEDYLFMSINKTGGQYYFDFSTKQFVSFSSTHNGWGSPWNIVKTSKGYFISTSYSAYGALYLYSNGIATIIDETSARYKWSIFECSNGLIIGGNANDAILFKYDESTNTMIEIAESNSYVKRYTNAYFEHAGYVYFSSNVSNYYGTYRFNINTFVFEKISTSASIQSTYPQSDVGAFFDSHNNLYLLLAANSSSNASYIMRVNSGETTFSLITIYNCSCDYITQINDDNLFISSAASGIYAVKYGSVIYNISTGTQTLVSRLSLYMNNNNFYQYTTGRYYYKLNSTLDALEKVDIEPNFNKFILTINSTCQSMLYYNKMYAILNGSYASANAKIGYAIDNTNNCALILNVEEVTNEQ